MGRGENFWERMAEETDLTAEVLPGQPIIEIVGNYRILIEKHMGVKAYSREKIVVKVKYGCICVCGCGLELIRMTREQLVIRGEIEGISLQRRG